MLLKPLWSILPHFHSILGMRIPGIELFPTLQAEAYYFAVGDLFTLAARLTERQPFDPRLLFLPSPSLYGSP